ncbi:MAG TPA: CBS domain-containing protein [Polyangiaceae bacterium]|jgi:CBS domain-containing protein|nr:CBS domain-containing protein [Polyangiaceae bacterium]
MIHVTSSTRDEQLPYAFRVMVCEVMSTALLVAHPEEQIERVRERSLERGVHHVIVLHRDGDLMGMVCACDMDDVWPDARVRDGMSGSPMYIGENQTLAAAAETMLRYGIGALPVLNGGGRLSGIVCRSDLRSLGVLPNQRGVDRCASCGGSHRLLPRNGGGVCFCRSCVEAGRHTLDDFYVVLGGGD